MWMDPPPAPLKKLDEDFSLVTLSPGKIWTKKISALWCTPWNLRSGAKGGTQKFSAQENPR